MTLARAVGTVPGYSNVVFNDNLGGGSNHNLASGSHGSGAVNNVAGKSNTNTAITDNTSGALNNVQGDSNTAYAQADHGSNTTATSAAADSATTSRSGGSHAMAFISGGKISFC